MKRSHYLLLLMGGICTALFFYLDNAGLLLISSLIGNLAAGFIGSFIVVLFVERNLENQRAQQELRVKQVLWTTLRGPILHHLVYLLRWKKLGARASGNQTNTLPEVGSFEEAFGKDYFDDLRGLNPRGEYEQIAEVLTKFKEGLSLATEKYLIFLYPAEIESLEGIINSDFMNCFISLGSSHGLGRVKGQGWAPIWFPFTADQPPRWLQTHIGLVIHFMQSFEGSQENPITVKGVLEYANIPLPNESSSEI